ncbi:MAG: ribbon-helix-helix protein, CopG family [Deltaproteobacteria bacterium]|nr:ribbon-helix-helix protein, CopG family [Deltaproteobacteria bacterium]
MLKTRVTVSLDPALPREVRALVSAGRFPSRSSVIEAAVAAELRRMRRTRLGAACRELGISEERAMADAGLSADAADWPGC